MENKILPRNKELNPFSRNLRNNMTKQEKHLWYDFLKKQKQQFYRQRIIGQYIVDFYCPTARLVIELDGSQHYEEKIMEYDKRRSLYMNDLGLTVLRFTNLEIGNHFESVCMTILSHLTVTAPLPTQTKVAFWEP